MHLEDIASAPNPQFVRLPFVDLCGTWDFAYDDHDIGLAQRWFEDASGFDRKVTVPYPPESALSGIGDESFHPVCWYRRTFQDPRAGDDRRILLRFGAVDYAATVWVDGAYVGGHEGGSTPFALDITDAVDSNREDHVVTVRVVDDPHDLEQPRGKQDWLSEPHTIFYRRTSGLWQPVWLETSPKVRIEDIRWTFDRARWSVGIEVSLNTALPAGSTVTALVELEDGHLASGTWSTSGRSVRGSLDLRANSSLESLHQLLWSPESPNLLHARVTVETAGGNRDEVLTYTGLRTVETSERGVLINGRPVFQRLVLSQGFWPESHLAAPSRDAIEREVDLILALGFNGARLHQKPEDPRLLFEADRKGLLLWGEIGNAFRYSDRAIDRHAREWREVVVRDRNHPSIIAWVPFNESWGIEDVGHRPDQQHAVHAAYHATHALDGTRPVIGNDGWENVAGDIVTAHDYSWDPGHLDHLFGPDATPQRMRDEYRAGHRRLTAGDFSMDHKPVILSEFGGVSFAPEEDQSWYGYGSVRTGDEFIERLDALVGAVQDSPAIAGFCYTQLTDTLQETNGLLDEHRVPKTDIETLRGIISGQKKKGPR